MFISHIKKQINIYIIGCVVNGPGEANMTNIGITGGGNNTHMIYVDGKKNNIIKNVDLAQKTIQIDWSAELLE